MAKKKVKTSAQERNDSRVPVQIRFDPEAHRVLVKMCGDAEISFNQLINGLAKWAMKSGMAGELVNEDGSVTLRRQPGCISFGTVRKEWCEGSIDAYMDHYGEKPTSRYALNGNIVFVLDYTERRVVREEE